MSKLKRYLWLGNDMKEAPPGTTDGGWAIYHSALDYARSEREAGAKQEREEIIGALEEQRSLEHPEEAGISEGVRLSRIGRRMGLTLAITLIGARSRGAKVCKCLNPLKEGHWSTCPLYDPPKACVCFRDNFTGSKIHHPDCPCYEPPKKVCTCGSGSSGRAHGLRLGEREIGNLEGNMTLIKEHGGVYGQIRMTEGWMDAIDDLLHDWRALAPKERGKG